MNPRLVTILITLYFLLGLVLLPSPGTATPYNP
jgi:hypothetical protein